MAELAPHGDLGSVLEAAAPGGGLPQAARLEVSAQVRTSWSTSVSRSYSLAAHSSFQTRPRSKYLATETTAHSPPAQVAQLHRADRNFLCLRASLFLFEWRVV